MKTNSIKVGLLICTLLLLGGQSRAQYKPDVYANLLTVNGHSFDQTDLWRTSKGVLALVEGDPQVPNHKPVPFRLSLRRAGKVVKHWPAGETEGVYSVQLEDLWLDARPGDELIVEPFDGGELPSAGSPGKRVIKLKGLNWLAHCLPPPDKC